MGLGSSHRRLVHSALKRREEEKKQQQWVGSERLWIPSNLFRSGRFSLRLLASVRSSSPLSLFSVLIFHSIYLLSYLPTLPSNSNFHFSDQILHSQLFLGFLSSTPVANFFTVSVCKSITLAWISSLLALGVYL